MGVKYLYGIDVTGQSTFSTNVGIGTLSPVYKLQVVNSGNTLLQLNGNNTLGTIDTGFTISADDSKNIYLYQRENAAAIFGTNNTERLRITSAGNVGIGTTAPAYKLDVIGTGRFIHTAGAPSLNIRASDANFALMSILGNQTGDVNWLLMSGYPAAGDFTIRQSDTVNALTLAKTSGAATFSSSVTASSIIKLGGTSTQYLMADGSVSTLTNPVTGTGTTNYLPKWTSGSAIGNSIVTEDGGNTLRIIAASAAVRLDGSRDYLLQTVDTDGRFRIYDQTAALERITLISSGNVGIGTTTPLRKLHVAGEVAINASGSQYYGVYINGAGEGANPNILIGDWHNSSANFTWDSVGNYLRIDAQNSTIGAPIVFSGNDGVLEYARFTATGSLGIGTTAPLYKLHVDDDVAYGGIFIEGDNAPGLSIRDNSGTSLSIIYVQSTAGSQGNLRISSDNNNTATTPTIEFLIGGSEKMRILDGGNVGIGTTAPQTLLHLTHANPILLLEETDQIVDSKRWGIQSETSILKFRAFNDALTTAVDVMSMTRTGNVGIGTTTPGYKLDVTGDARITGGAEITSNASTVGLKVFGGGNLNVDYLQVGYSGGSASPMFRIGYTGAATFSSSVTAANILTTGTGTIFDTNNAGTSSVRAAFTNTGGTFFIGKDNSTGTSFGAAYASILYEAGANPMVFWTNATERLRITSAGNVGIGTTSPNVELAVYQTSTPRLHLQNSISGTASNKGFQLALSGNDGYLWNWQNGSTIFGNNAAEAMRITSAGNVGIGTTSPAKILTIAANSQTWAGAPQVAFYDTISGQVDARNWTIGAISTNYGNFTIANSTAAGGDPTNARLTINKDGNVGIGTTSPSYKLDVSGVGRFSRTGSGGDVLTVLGPNGYSNNIFLGVPGTTAEGLRLTYNSTNGSSEINNIYNAALYIKTNATTRLTIASTGAATFSSSVTTGGDINIINANLSNQENLDVDTGTEVIAIAPIALYTAAFFDFVVKNGANVRSGTVYACHDGTSVEYTETSTADLGNTSAVVFTVDISAGNMRLLATTTTDNWSIKTLTRTI